MTIRLHRGDLPDLSRYTGAVAIDTETMGLDPHRDRLCVVQLSPGDGSADVVQIAPGATDAPNLKKLLADPAKLKIFHFARFDIAVLFHAFGVMPAPAVLHQDRLAAGAHLYRQARPERRHPRPFGHRSVQAAAALGLGFQRVVGGAGRLCRLRRAASACASGQARYPTDPRKQGRTGQGLLRVPADPRQARSCRMGRRRHFFAFLRVPAPIPGHIQGLSGKGFLTPAALDCGIRLQFSYCPNQPFGRQGL